MKMIINKIFVFFPRHTVLVRLHTFSIKTNNIIKSYRHNILIFIETGQFYSFCTLHEIQSNKSMKYEAKYIYWINHFLNKVLTQLAQVRTKRKNGETIH